jgi:GDP-L-fucose synthase
MGKNSKILITGARGLVGIDLIEELKKEGFQNLIYPTSKELDLREREKVFSFFEKEKPDYVFHLAAVVGGIKANMNFPVEFLKNNLLLNTNLIDACFKHNVKKLINLGSSCIYPKLAEQPLKESSLLSGKFEPTNEGYALSKITSLKLCEYYNREYNTNFISLIPPNLYGKNEKFDLEKSHVLSSLIKRFHESKINNLPEIEIWGTGDAQREFLYSGDLVKGLLFAMENISTEDLYEKGFLNIGSDQEISIKDLSFLIKEVVGFEGKIIFDHSKPEGMKRKILDTSKIKKLGFSCNTPLKEGIEKTYQAYLNLLAKPNPNK